MVDYEIDYETFEKIRKIFKELNEKKVSEIEEIEEAVDLTKNNSDISVYMILKDNIVLFDDGGYHKTYAIIFNDTESARIFYNIVKELAEKIFNNFGFDTDIFINFIRNSSEFKVVELNY